MKTGHATSKYYVNGLLEKHKRKMQFNKKLPVPTILSMHRELKTLQELANFMNRVTASQYKRIMSEATATKQQAA